MPRIFRIVALGDSVIWGAGLRSEEKFTHRIAAWIRQWHADWDVRMEIIAHAGAMIGFDSAVVREPLDPEVPTSFPTIVQQLDAFSNDPPSIDLVLINGGINDIGVTTLVSPRTAPEEIRQRAARHCGADLARLLIAAGEKFNNPNARFIVPGYYPILSRESSFLRAMPFLTLCGVLLESPFLPASPIARIVENLALFWRESETHMAAAVSCANREDAGNPASPSRFHFAPAAFAERNAMFAPDPWVFGLNALLGPQDSVAEYRRQVCDRDEVDPLRRQICYRGSAGHPNARGSDAYFDAIRPVLQSFGL